MGCKHAVSAIFLLKYTQSTASRFNITQDSGIKTVSSSSCFRYPLHDELELRTFKKTSSFFKIFGNRMCGLSHFEFLGVHLNILFVEDLLPLNIFIHEKDIVDGGYIGELARRSGLKNEKFVRFLGYNTHKCYEGNSTAVFQSFH